MDNPRKANGNMASTKRKLNLLKLPRQTESPALPRVKHGLTSLKQAVKGLGGRVIDRRTSLGKSLARWRTDVLTDLGGAESVSKQQETIVDLAVKTKLMLDSVDAWILTRPSLINHRRRSVFPVVRERMQLADGLAKYMAMLGLERRERNLDPFKAEELRQLQETEGNGAADA